MVALKLQPLLAGTPASGAAETKPYTSQLANPHEAWLTEAWTEDNAPYLKIRLDLEALNDNHLITVSLMDSYRQSYLEHPDDPENAFRWVYATYLASKSITSFPQEDIAKSAILDRFPKPSPKTYDYDRLRFLLAVQGIAKPKYEVIAEKLYSQDPNDVRVTANYARVLSMTHIPKNKRKALDLAQKLIHKEPNSSKHETLLGSIYLDSWYYSHNIQDKKLAIDAYQAFLRKSQDNDPFRSQAEFLINLLKNDH